MPSSTSLDRSCSSRLVHVEARTCRSYLEVFCKKDVLKNFAEFTGKYCCRGLFFNKDADLQLY